MMGENKKSKAEATKGSKQRTLKTAICCSGIGLHSGSKVGMSLLPAPPNTGIIFRRVDIAGKGAEIAARWNTVVDTRMCSVIGNDAGVSIGTVEHLMAALAGMAIDNLIVEITASEVPVMDGSASPFVFLLECAGVVEQDAPRKAIKVLKSVTVQENGKAASLHPGEEGFTIDFEIDFPGTAVASQASAMGISQGAFKTDVSRARTFGFLEEVAQLQAMGLARGGSLDNAVVVSGDRILNEDGLRYDDEFVRHKILDALGDLYLCGHPIVGHYSGKRAGHALTNKLLHKLFADDSNWCFVDAADSAKAVRVPATAMQKARVSA